MGRVEMLRSLALLEPLEDRRLYSVVPSDPGYRLMSNLGDIVAAGAWRRTTGDLNVVVASIDTGIEYTHPDLYANIWINQGEIPRAIKRRLRDVDGDGRISFYDLNSRRNRRWVTDVSENGVIDADDLLAPAAIGGWADGINGVGFRHDTFVDDIIGWDFADNDNDPRDFDGHGTHTAGTIAAQGNNRRGVVGVAWKTSLMAVKIFDDYGNGAPSDAIAAAIRYSADAGARVSNNSWGAPGISNKDPIYAAIAYAGKKGQVFVSAAGNESYDNDFGLEASFPATFDLNNIISVAASDTQGDLSWFSNFGGSTVDLAAPGDEVLSTYLNGSYEYLTGTSMAAPEVSGTIALMIARYPRLTVKQIKADLLAAVDTSVSLRFGTASGGRLNASDAVYAAAVRRTLAAGHAPGVTQSTMPKPLPGIFSTQSIARSTVQSASQDDEESLVRSVLP